MLNFNWLSGIPVEAARWVFLVLFIVIGRLVWLAPDSYIFEGVEHPRWYHDLRWWAIGVLGTIFATYCVF